MTATGSRAATVSAFFPSPEAVDAVVARLLDRGLPRDLVDVAVSPAAARIFYPRLARAPGNMGFAYAGIGALAGLIGGSLVSLAIVAASGFTLDRTLALVQLLGPNVATLAGAVLGGLVGLFTRQKPAVPFGRVGDRDAILLVVSGLDPTQVIPIKDFIAKAGGEALQLHFGS